MKTMKKVFCLVLSVAMLCSMAAVVSADTTAAGGNLLDFNVETIVVPTALKMTLNPNGYTITTKYVKATSYDSNAKYFSDNAGTTPATVADEDAFNAGTFYVAQTSTAQVVSFNYGIANKSTGAKNVTVKFAANFTANPNEEGEITFVETAAEAEAYNETTNENGAKAGELKIYLAVAASTAEPTVEMYVKTKDTALDDSKTYYTTADGTVYTAVTSPDVDDIGTYYEYTTTIGPEITAAALSDVNMTADTTGVQAFVAGTEAKANAAIAFKLGEARYSVTAGEVIDFNTTMGALGEKLSMDTLGGVAGFTLTGAINANADWTKAEASAITITPTFSMDDSDGTETAEGGFNQIATVEEPVEPTYTDAGAASGTWVDSNLWISPDGTNGFDNNTLTLEYSTDNTTFTAFDPSAYAVNEDNWLSISWTNISTGTGIDGTATYYLRVTDTTALTQYTFTWTV